MKEEAGVCGWKWKHLYNQPGLGVKLAWKGGMPDWKVKSESLVVGASAAAYTDQLRRRLGNSLLSPRPPHLNCPAPVPTTSRR
ncbi:hypothetical protein Pcinc_040599 [Petrolisthes cinctipes]|uniref:Uncharacterized protein n=1 Tax=Petrolisthes cinctipes TaxID=88211 RepID=A0AAE1BL64_PETCI|nr:hypothetical protein Pcinc_040599 [Petrolisthes cinctipes]